MTAIISLNTNFQPNKRYIYHFLLPLTNDYDDLRLLFYCWASKLNALNVIYTYYQYVVAFMFLVLLGCHAKPRIAQHMDYI